ncbi:hypothetical protein [Neisseria iguanae]|uniref:hypothetical protein n=1 Tax=Neisseria iguanae TaxID=90242 RepID=UPI001472AC04|nr:hypothetical protein [Neisseria iguanae]
MGDKKLFDCWKAFSDNIKKGRLKKLGERTGSRKREIKFPKINNLTGQQTI